ncbi:unnamed protein product [Spirodela intermedia]|uniref:Uncharacterized protein n=1 Tax=Spirodela intermedia TaxID=51605 RepID=A0A7I8KG87_SPIIN|nr:unnamed protein product [Spirodela intermedia]
MVAFPRLTSALLLLLCVLLHGGAAAGKCRLESIGVKQEKTGAVVEGKPEYEVTVRNGCLCPQSRVVVRCYGLSSLRAVDPRAIRPVGETDCLVNGGRPIVGGAAVKFRYAWTTPQDFPLVSSKISC